MQAGYMDKAQKYTEKALMQIEKLRSKCCTHLFFLIFYLFNYLLRTIIFLLAVDNHPMLNTYQLVLLEHIAMCRLVMGNRTLAIKEVIHFCLMLFMLSPLNLKLTFYSFQTVQALNICYREPKLKLRHRPQIHALLGLYSMSMNCTDAAEVQLNAALRVG